jgi:hypothetical protein
MQPHLQVHHGLVSVHPSSNHTITSPTAAKYKLWHLYNCAVKDTLDLEPQTQIKDGPHGLHQNLK